MIPHLYTAVTNYPSFTGYPAFTFTDYPGVTDYPAVPDFPSFLFTASSTVKTAFTFKISVISA